MSMGPVNDSFTGAAASMLAQLGAMPPKQAIQLAQMQAAQAPDPQQQQMWQQVITLLQQSMMQPQQQQPQGNIVSQTLGAGMGY